MVKPAGGKRVACAWVLIASICCVDGGIAIERTVIALVPIVELGLDLGLVSRGREVPSAGVEPDSLDFISVRSGLCVGLGKLQSVRKALPGLGARGRRIEHQLGCVFLDGSGKVFL